MTTKVRRQEMGNFIALLAGVASIGMSVWGLPLQADDVTLREPVVETWGFFAGAGVLALAAVFLAQRSTSAARGLLVFAGVVHLIGTVVMWDMGPVTRISAITLGLMMILGSATLGRVRA